MIVPPTPLQHPVAPVLGGVLVEAAADLPHLMTGPAVTLEVPGTWSSSSYQGAGTALLVQVAGRPIPGFVLVKPPEHCPAHPHSLPLNLVLE